MIAMAVSDFWRFIWFQPLRGDMRTNAGTYLAIGLAITWIVGLGRTWDYTSAPWWFRTGLTSVVYALVLAGFIWVIGLALKPQRWRYQNVLLMVTMTALPGLIYAAPVERFMNADAARVANMIFLLIVAAWRMALYRHFLRKVAQLPPMETTVVWLLPPTIIIAVVGLFGTLNAIMRGMAGVRDPVGEAIDGVVVWITLASWFVLPLLLIAFVYLVFKARKRT
jgi:hypothetical protein